MKHTRTKPIAILSASALITTAMALGAAAGPANAQQVGGNAPFINSWLVSGPFDTPVADEIYGCEIAEAVNLARTAKATASSSLDANPPAQLIDGDLRKQWVAENDAAPTVTLAWDAPISLNEVRLAQWGDARHVNGSYALTFTLADGSTITSPTVASTSGSPSSPTVYSHGETIADVVSISVAIDAGLTPYPSVTGLSEIEVYERVEPAEGEASIDPAVGGTLGDDAESNEWEYFDDRVYNRNYDDYQDLYGYYSVKKGEDTRNKFVYAHTYVYSPEARKGFVNVGASGSYRLFVNDDCVTGTSTPVEVQKDLTKQEVDLKQGWNKVLLQIEHTYTEDVNGNGVPIAKDQDVAYLGFYGRVGDANGNRIDGIVSSVNGPSDKLKIDTRPLEAAGADEKALPDGALPTGYLEWPYVWNKSVTGSQHGVSASSFQFIASGGEPGYTWELVDGELPKGLELNADGTIADGLVDGRPDLASTKGIISPDARIGDYEFTLEVTDADGATTTKDFTLTVEDRPNRKFEEGRVGALTHATPVYRYFVDPNYSVDQWAQRAKEQGHSLVSIEALQQNYYWPSKFADPAHDRNKYLPKDADGKVVDGLKPFADAVKRYGMDFGLYYATEGGGLQHYSTDVFVQNVEDLLDRYDPAYLYFDGPQTMPNANYDVMYSAVRNHGAEVIIDSNAWGEEYGDPDLRTAEASHIFANTSADHLVKRTPMEPWKIVLTDHERSPYYGQRDDFRLVTQEMIMNAGRGYVDNNDQTVTNSRGPNWDSPTDIATRYPRAAQEYIDVREGLADWFASSGVDLHESTTGTTPFFLPGYGYDDDGLGNYDRFAFPGADVGPQWGYATRRDNVIYLHILAGPDGKKGFDALEGGRLSLGGIEHEVTAVTHLNTGTEISSFTQDGEEVALDLSAVAVDPVDTIIKIETDDAARTYELTDATIDASPLRSGRLKLIAGGYMTYPALAAELDKVVFTAPDTGVAKVNRNGTVIPRADGSVEVEVAVKSGEVTKKTRVTVSVKDGVAYIGDDLSSAVLRIGGKEAYTELPMNAQPDYALEGRSGHGQSVRLDAADITWHAGIVDLDGGTKTEPIAITEVDTFGFAKGRVTTPQVAEPTRGVVWAEVSLDGKTVTSNRVFLDLLPTREVAATASVTTSDGSETGSKLTDGIVIDAEHLTGSGWSTAADGASWARFDLAAPAELSSIGLQFNKSGQRYANTPRKIVIQTSVDGDTWTDAQSAAGPDGSVYWGAVNAYPVTGVAQHVRISFPEGSAGATLDLLEAQIHATHEMTGLASIEAEPKLRGNKRTAKVEVTGTSFQGDAVSVRSSAVKIVTGDADVVAVDSRGVISAVGEGRATITVDANVDGYRASDFFDVMVDADGRLSLPMFMESVQLSLSGSSVRVGHPVVADVEAKLNTGAAANPAELTTKLEFSDPRLAQVEGTNTIVLPEPVAGSVSATVRATVTFDGQTLTSGPVALTMTGDNLASAATVTVSSVRDRSGVPDGDDRDDRYVGAKAVDGDTATSWASKQTDVSPWVRLDFGGPVQVDRVNLVDRGHDVNQIVEGLLEWEGGSKHVTGIRWEGQPDNMITLDAPVTTSWLKFTIDPDNVFDNQVVHGEAGLAEFGVYAAAAERSIVSATLVAAETTIGQQPTLPAEVGAVYSDGTTGAVAVSWDAVPAEKLAEAGWFIVEGALEGGEVRARAVVAVR
ncbi:discoidin domain-containing protein [Agromyces sp. NPDC056379]|uniref:discoidin domain-containing protein n=1 Tax=unclassified Agromyces TaxID=2639701 RepID=UPI0035D988DF